MISTILLSRQEFLKSLFLLLQVHFLLRSLNGIPHSPSYGSVHDMQEIGSLHQFRNVPVLHQPDLFPVYKSKMPVFPIPAIHNSELSYHKVFGFLNIIYGIANSFATSTFFISCFHDSDMRSEISFQIKACKMDSISIIFYFLVKIRLQSFVLSHPDHILETFD